MPSESPPLTYSGCPSPLSHLTLLLKSIKNKDWDTFDKLVTQINKKTFQAFSGAVAETSEFNGMSFLHLIVAKHPPLEVVVNVVKICPGLLEARDRLERTVLHVAAGVGASALIIAYLSAAYPEACKIQDGDGRTPLHYACDTQIDCGLLKNAACRRQPPPVEIVRALLRSSAAPASMEDDGGVSPLECAIVSEADIRVIKLLQRTARKYMRKIHAEEKRKRART